MFGIGHSMGVTVHKQIVAGGGLPESLSDDFTGTNNSEPSATLWYQNETDVDVSASDISIQSNELMIQLTGDLGGTRRIFNLSNYRLSGDFDIQIKHTLLQRAGSTGSVYGRLVITDGLGSTTYTSIHKNFANNKWSGKIEGNALVEATRFSANGYTRITRVGSTITTYYDDGALSAWTQIDSKAGASTNDMQVYLELYVQSTAETGLYETRFDDFVHNSGTVAEL